MSSVTSLEPTENIALEELPPVPAALWLIVGALVVLAVAGAALSGLWLVNAPAEQFAEPLRLFLCH